MSNVSRKKNTIQTKRKGQQITGTELNTVDSQNQQRCHQALPLYRIRLRDALLVVPHGILTFHCAFPFPHTVCQQCDHWISTLTVHGAWTNIRAFFWGVMTSSLMPAVRDDGLCWTILSECCLSPVGCRIRPDTYHCGQTDQQLRIFCSGMN